MYSQSVPALISKNVGNTLTNYNTWGGILYNIKEFGAKGDGSTNDTTAIQAAINACVAAGAGIVYFPPGTYRVSQTINITSPNIRIVGSGLAISIVKALSGFNGTTIFSFVNADYSGIEKIGVDGESSLFGTTEISGVVFYRCIEPYLRDCRVYDTSSTAVQLSNCNRALVFANALYGTTNSRAGLYCGGVDQVGFDQGGHKILCNIIHDCHLDAIIFNSPNGIISNNELYNNGKTTTGTTPTGAGIYCNSDLTGINLTLSNNLIYNNDGNGIDIYGASKCNITVTGNMIRDNNYAGVTCAGPYVTIAGNTIKNNGAAPTIDATQDSGIVIYDNVTNITATSNTIYDDKSVKTQSYGIRIKTGTDFLTISGNALVGNKLDALSVTSSGYNNQICANNGNSIAFNLTTSTSIPVANNGHLYKLRIFNVSDGTYGEFLLRGSSTDLVEQYDPYSAFEITDTGTTTAVFYTSGAYVIKNRAASTKFYRYSLEIIW